MGWTRVLELEDGVRSWQRATVQGDVPEGLLESEVIVGERAGHWDPDWCEILNAYFESWMHNFKMISGGLWKLAQNQRNPGRNTTSECMKGDSHRRASSLRRSQGVSVLPGRSTTRCRISIWQLLKKLQEVWWAPSVAWSHSPVKSTDVTQSLTEPNKLWRDLVKNHSYDSAGSFESYQLIIKKKFWSYIHNYLIHKETILSLFKYLPHLLNTKMLSKHNRNHAKKKKTCKKTDIIIQFE